jgi:hypothetical protein
MRQGTFAFVSAEQLGIAAVFVSAQPADFPIAWRLQTHDLSGTKRKKAKRQKRAKKERKRRKVLLFQNRRQK